MLNVLFIYWQWKKWYRDISTAHWMIWHRTTFLVLCTVCVGLCHLLSIILLTTGYNNGITHALSAVCLLVRANVVRSSRTWYVGNNVTRLSCIALSFVNVCWSSFILLYCWSLLTVACCAASSVVCCCRLRSFAVAFWCFETNACNKCSHVSRLLMPECCSVVKTQYIP